MYNSEQTDAIPTSASLLQNRLLAAGLPVSIWHKKWSEKFTIMNDGNKVGYANDSGWYFCAETYDEFIETYSRFHNRGVVKPCR